METRRQRKATQEQTQPENTDSEVFEEERTADQILDALPPTKSAAEYVRAWNYFTQFRAPRENTDKEPGEAIYVKYFDYLRNTKKYEASSMWTTYSMLNNTHMVSKIIRICSEAVAKEKILGMVATW